MASLLLQLRMLGASSRPFASRFSSYAARSSKVLLFATAASSSSFSTSSTSIIDEPEEEQPNVKKRQRRRRLDVAIVGLPNAGKSQLLNVLTEASVSAVSRKRHTTREEVLGFRTVDDAQLLFLDTPGFLRRQEARQDGLPRDLRISSASPETERVDHSLLVVDAARRLTDDVRETLIELMLLALRSEGRVDDEESISDDEDDEEEDDGNVDEDDGNVDEEKEEAGSTPEISKRKFSVVLNKVDLVHPKSYLLDLAQEIGSMAEECILCHERGHDGRTGEEEGDATTPGDGDNNFDEELNKNILEKLPMFFYVSSLKEEGTDDVLEYLLDSATPCESWEVEAGQSTVLTPEARVEEIVREKLYRCLHREVPYSIRQNNTLFETKRDRETGKLGLLIHQELIVATKSHSTLVRGTGGRTLERIRETAERDLEKIFGCRVVLQLFIKLLSKSKRRNNWSE